MPAPVRSAKKRVRSLRTTNAEMTGFLGTSRPSAFSRKVSYRDPMLPSIIVCPGNIGAFTSNVWIVDSTHLSRISHNLNASNAKYVAWDVRSRAIRTLTYTS